jgi:hypothetical protein
LFNKNRSEDILLKRFIDVVTGGEGTGQATGLEFHHGSESLLRNILESGDRKKFYIYAYENDRRSSYDRALYSKISDPWNAAYYDNTNFNHILAATIFHFVDSLTSDKINLRFEIYSDLGDLNISMTHTMLPCNRLKQQMEQQNPNSNNNANAAWWDYPRYKIDTASPIKITCSLSKI